MFVVTVVGWSRGACGTFASERVWLVVVAVVVVVVVMVDVEVCENGVRTRGQGPGESFGEIALLRDVPRTATVRALGPTSLFALDRQRFIAAVTGHARAHQSARAVSESRLDAERR